MVSKCRFSLVKLHQLYTVDNLPVCGGYYDGKENKKKYYQHDKASKNYYNFTNIYLHNYKIITYPSDMISFCL